MYDKENFMSQARTLTDKIMQESHSQISKIRKSFDETAKAWFLLVLKDYYVEHDVEMFLTVIDVINKKLPLGALKERLDLDGFRVEIRFPDKEYEWVSNCEVKVYQNNYILCRNGEVVSEFKEYMDRIVGN